MRRSFLLTPILASVLASVLAGCVVHVDEPKRRHADPEPAPEPLPEPEPEPEPEPATPEPEPGSSEAPDAPPEETPPPTGRDKTLPIIRVISPPEGAVLETAPVVIEIDVRDDRGIASVTINDAEVATEPGRFKARMSQPQRGLNQIFVEAWDTTGNKSRVVRTFSYLIDETPAPPPPVDDKAPPVIEIVEPKPDSLARLPIYAVVRVTDNHAVKRVRIDGVEAKALDGGLYRIAIHRPRTGQNVVRVLANDVAGNVASAQWSFHYDTTPPGVEAKAWLVVEGLAGDLDATLEINGVAIPFDPDTGEYSARVPPDPKNPDRLTIVSTDEFGNKTTQVRLLR